MRGIRREHGAAQRQAKPLLREDLFVVLAAMGDRLKDLRNKALLLIGFAGGLRRSELVAVTCNDFEWVQQGIILVIRRSKTDQDGAGRRIGIPFGRTVHCPVRALENWLSAAPIKEGPFSAPSIDTSMSRSVDSPAKPCPRLFRRRVRLDISRAPGQLLQAAEHALDEVALAIGNALCREPNQVGHDRGPPRRGSPQTSLVSAIAHSMVATS